jgi:hypothetical protein
VHFTRILTPAQIHITKQPQIYSPALPDKSGQIR